MRYPIEVRAFHEAGHAIAHHVFGDVLREVSVQPDVTVGSGGHTIIYKKRAQIGPDTPKNRHAVERIVVSCLAGMEAQKQHGDTFMGGGRYDRQGAGNDLQEVADLVERMDW